MVSGSTWKFRTNRRLRRFGIDDIAIPEEPSEFLPILILNQAGTIARFDSKNYMITGQLLFYSTSNEQGSYVLDTKPTPFWKRESLTTRIMIASSKANFLGVDNLIVVDDFGWLLWLIIDSGEKVEHAHGRC